MTPEQLAPLTVKSVGASIAAVFGLSSVWDFIGALIAALLGATGSLHLEPPAKGSGVWRVAGQILALGLMAWFLAIALPFAPGFGWSEEIKPAVRAGVLGFCANWLPPVLKEGANWIRGKLGRV
jgi:hypothetical protein